MGEARASLRESRRGDAIGLGKLMKASHASLRDDFEVSNRELNVMVECAERQPGFGPAFTFVRRPTALTSSRFLKTIQQHAVAAALSSVAPAWKYRNFPGRIS